MHAFASQAPKTRWNCEPTFTPAYLPAHRITCDITLLSEHQACPHRICTRQKRHRVLVIHVHRLHGTHECADRIGVGVGRKFKPENQSPILQVVRLENLQQWCEHGEVMPRHRCTREVRTASVELYCYLCWSVVAIAIPQSTP